MWIYLRENFGPQKIWFQKNSGPKNFRCKNFWSKNFGPKKCWSKKCFGWKFGSKRVRENFVVVNTFFLVQTSSSHIPRKPKHLVYCIHPLVVYSWYGGYIKVGTRLAGWPTGWLGPQSVIIDHFVAPSCKLELARFS